MTLANLDAAVARAHAPLVVRGQVCSRDGKQERIGVIDVAARPRVVFDEWLPAAALVGDQRIGAWDAMHSTRWKYAWGRAARGDDGSFALYDTRGARVRAIDAAVADVRGLVRTERVRVQRVEAQLSEGWLVRSVVLVDDAGRARVVARKRELGVVLDPTYDGIDLMMDASWATALARSLADALGVFYVSSKDFG